MISFIGLAALEALGHVDGWHWLIWLAAFIIDGTAWEALSNVR